MRTSDILTQPLGLQQKEVPPAHDHVEATIEAPPADTLTRWMRICTVEEIPRLGARVVNRRGEDNIAIFRTADDKLFALADRCPHRGGPLSQGIVFGERVACPLHNTCVDLGSGCAVAPDKGQVECYSLKIEADVVYVELRDAHG